jgi:hypothetical protein
MLVTYSHLRPWGGGVLYAICTYTVGSFQFETILYIYTTAVRLEQCCYLQLWYSYLQSQGIFASAMAGYVHTL